MKIRNWGKFQHYKRRNPPWIKLHKSLLDDRAWHALSGDASKMLAACWLIASERDGELPGIEDIAWRLRMEKSKVALLVSQLDQWLEQDASTMLAECLQDATPETETETEKKSEKTTLAREFAEIFWPAYPNKAAKPKALQSFISKRHQFTLQAIMDGLARYKRSKPPDRQWLNPTTFLNQERFNDELASVGVNGHAPPTGPKRTWAEIKAEKEAHK